MQARQFIEVSLKTLFEQSHILDTLKTFNSEKKLSVIIHST